VQPQPLLEQPCDVRLEHAAVVALCGSSVESWQRLKPHQQAKLVPELVSEQVPDQGMCVDDDDDGGGGWLQPLRYFLAALSVVDTTHALAVAAGCAEPAMGACAEVAKVLHVIQLTPVMD
jgi:hypothetical protein